MRNGYILVIDSGNGGVFTLNKIRKVLPFENYIMFKDISNCPYGNKSAKILQKITEKNLRKICDNYEIKLIVIACNTLGSVLNITDLENKSGIKFFAISPIIEKLKQTKQNTIVLATKTTIKSNVELKKITKQNAHIYSMGFKTLAKLIDENLKNLDVLVPYLKKKMKRFNYIKMQNVILGCTHFNLIKNQLKLVLNNDHIKFFENSGLLANNIKNWLNNNNLLSEQVQRGIVVELSTL